MRKPLAALSIWKDANALLLAIEQSVRHFPRYHKYTIGQEMRQQAMVICRLIVRSYHYKGARIQSVQLLNEAIDDLKIQRAKELCAFRHFKAFQSIAELAVAVGKQSGGWKQRLQTA